MAGKSYKYVQQMMKPDGAIDAFFADIEELAGEAREIVDNASENLANTQRIQTFGDTADTLENIDRPREPVLPEALAAMELTVMVATPRSQKQGTSRAVRCENAASCGRAAIDAIREWCDEMEATEATEQKPTEDVLTELREWCDEVEGYIDEAEQVEFPGMYG